jgi:hypothetical protein
VLGNLHYNLHHRLRSVPLLFTRTSRGGLKDQKVGHIQLTRAST